MLENQKRIPVLGFGTWGIENGTATTEAVLGAIDVGYRHIDTAAGYGNDFAVGKAIKKCEVSREELFITSKLWNAYRGRENAVTACKRTLKLMKLEYLDSYLIHWPASRSEYNNWQEINLDTWRGMEDLYREGLVKTIGVSNFLPCHLDVLVNHADIKPMINQIELHPGKNQKEVLDYCIKNNILPMAWSPLGSGHVLDYPDILDMAKRYEKTTAQICLRYCIQKGAGVITRSTNIQRMESNTHIFNFKLSIQDMTILDNLSELGDSGLHPDDPELSKKLQEF